MIENFLSEWQHQVSNLEWWMILLYYAFCVIVDWILEAARERAAKEEEDIQRLFSDAISYLALDAIIIASRTTWPISESRKLYIDNLFLAYKKRRSVSW